MKAYYSVEAYNLRDESGRTKEEVCITGILANTEDGAMFKAKLLVTRSNYRVIEVNIAQESSATYQEASI